MKSDPFVTVRRMFPARLSPQALVWFCLVGFFLAVSLALMPGAHASAPRQAGTPDVVITGTPAPALQTRSAQFAAGAARAPRLDIDANTVALYHLDSVIGKTIIEATGNYYGVLFGNATIATPGLFGGALLLDGRYGPGSYARAVVPGGMPQGTLEAFVDFSAACGMPNDTFTIASIGGEFGSSAYSARLIEDAGRLNFEIYTDGGWYVANSGINACRYLTGWDPPAAPLWPYERWRYHHVAGTWGPRGMEIWVDGILHGTTYPNYFSNGPNLGYACSPQDQLGVTYPYCPHPYLGWTYPGVYTGGLTWRNTLLIGCDPDGNPGHCHGGKIDEVRLSNIQRTFEPMYNPVPPATPTRTPTIAAPDPYPDFSVEALVMPKPATVAMTHTIWIQIKNSSNIAFNRAAVDTTPLVGQASGTRRAVNPALMSPRGYTGTSSYFFYVEVYVDLAKPAGVTTLGNCSTMDGGVNWGWVYNLGANQTVQMPMDCWLTPGNHAFYAQVDSCDDPSGELCSTRYGLVLEANDTNNIFPFGGPVYSGLFPTNFLPLIRVR